LKKLSKTINTFGLVANAEKPACPQLVRQAARLIQAKGLRALAEVETARFAGLKLDTCPDIPTLARRVDLLIVFGGDGTMLRVAREIAGLPAPILGINTGALGFLTAVQAQQLPLALEQVWGGEAELEARPLIQATGLARGERFHKLALNDFVVTRGAQPRLIEVEVTVDGQMLTRYRADGLIVCSPTGSTAYSLAAGGAVVNPAAEVFTITPICPHTLSNRSVVVSLRSTIEVQVHSSRVETVLTADGQPPIALATGDVVAIRQSRYTVKLIHLAGSSFFETLRRKLNWSGTNV
jgi:NAD+ kinase